MLIFYLQLIDDPDDRELFIQLYTEHKKAMLTRAKKILRNEDDAEDAVHDAFLKIAEKIEKISSMDCHKRQSYFVTIIESKAIDIYRKKSAHPQVMLSELSNYSITDSYDDGILANCMMKLPHEYRMVLNLRFYIGLTNSEIASALNISSALVRKRVQRAREQLEEILAMKNGNGEKEETNAV